MPGGDSRATHREFKTTQWFLLASASDDRGTAPVSAAGAAYVCEHYWQPVYWFLRARGFGESDAQDLTQSFFFHILRSGTLTRAMPAKGRFRSFLLGALKHFVGHHVARQRSAKRGGGFRQVDLATLPAADSAAIALAAGEGADAEERERALALFTRVHRRLAAEYEAAGKGRMFDVLNTFCISSGQVSASYAQMSEMLDRPVATVRSDVARLRAGYRRLIREEVAATVEPWAVEEELRRVIALICEPR